MSESDIQIILHRLDEMKTSLNEIHTEVKRTNGRVTELEKKDAFWEGQVQAKKPVGTIVTTIVAYTTISIITWYLLGRF